MKYIDAEKLKAEIKKRLKNVRDYMNGTGMRYKGPRYFKAQGKESVYDALLSTIDSLQQEQPDKETILRICKLHKVWSIMAPWENVEDFVMTNWNAENIV